MSDDLDPTFTSIRYPFSLDAGLKRLAREDDYRQHVEQLVVQTLLTAPGERVNRPDFGCGLKRMVFAPNNPASATLAQTAVHQALSRWLGSVIEVSSVQVEAVAERLEVKVVYLVKARGEKRYLNLEVTA
jgi:phage baseplate assembly protein W